MTLLPAIVGPTASGKTALSLALGRRLSCEIISCDSMQIWRGMDIGTAKPTAEERAALPHHLIDILSPGAPYSAADYAADAARLVGEILSRSHLPLFCGGTGLYLEAACRGTAAQADVPGLTAQRAKLEQEAAQPGGPAALWARLCACDGESAATIHPNNLRRVIRALEIYEATGIPKSEWDRRSRTAAPALRVLPMMITYPDRTLLYARIDRRIDEMLQAGLVDEVRGLYEGGLLPPTSCAAAAIGYKELLPYVQGQISLAEARAALSLSTRHYAKRQMTWFTNRLQAIPLLATDQSGKLRRPEDLADEAEAIYRRALQNEPII